MKQCDTCGSYCHDDATFCPQCRSLEIGELCVKRLEIAVKALAWIERNRHAHPANVHAVAKEALDEMKKVTLEG